MENEITKRQNLLCIRVIHSHLIVFCNNNLKIINKLKEQKEQNTQKKKEKKN
jgi:hypothetical protein